MRIAGSVDADWKRVQRCMEQSAGVGRFLKFFSLTMATQGCLLVNQVVLLPIELRVWGTDTVAQWVVLIAIANLAGISDLGLRNAGHSQLLLSVRSGDLAASREFKETWALARTLIMGITTVFLAYQLWAGASSSALLSVITISVAFDTLTMVRGAWLDTLGHFNKIEALYLGMIASRVALSLIALATFRASPAVLSFIWLLTSIGWMVAQAVLLRTPASLAFFAGNYRDLRWRSLEAVWFVVSEPAANWTRISLPLVVFAVFAPPAFITTYVAIRAIFASARQVIGQIARYTSVRYVQRLEDGKACADHIALRAIFACTIIGVVVSSAIIADHGRLLRIWLGSANVQADTFIIASFVVGAIAFGYQVIAGVMIRSGDVMGVAKRHYAYLGVCAAAALFVSIGVRSTSMYLMSLAAQEVVIAGLFVTALGNHVRRGSITAAAVACGALGLLWVAVTLDTLGLFSANSFGAIAGSFIAATLTAGLVTAILILDDFLHNRRRETSKLQGA